MTCAIRDACSSWLIPDGKGFKPRISAPPPGDSGPLWVVTLCPGQCSGFGWDLVPVLLLERIGRTRDDESHELRRAILKWVLEGLRCWRSSSAEGRAQKEAGCYFGRKVLLCSMVNLKLSEALLWLFGALSPSVAHGAVCPGGLLLYYWQHPV